MYFSCCLQVNVLTQVVERSATLCRLICSCLPDTFCLPVACMPAADGTDVPTAAGMQTPGTDF